LSNGLTDGLENVLQLAKFNRYQTLLRAFLKASLSNVVSGDRRSRIRDGADCWIFLAESKLPVVHVSELWPALGREVGHAYVGTAHPWELSYGESAVLDALVRHLRPRKIFEFGTFLGTTTKLLAEAAPAHAVIHTIDFPELPWPAPLLPCEGQTNWIGSKFRNDPEYEGVPWRGCASPSRTSRYSARRVLPGGFHSGRRSVLGFSEPDYRDRGESLGGSPRNVRFRRRVGVGEHRSLAGATRQ